MLAAVKIFGFLLRLRKPRDVRKGLRNLTASTTVDLWVGNETGFLPSFGVGRRSAGGLRKTSSGFECEENGVLGTEAHSFEPSARGVLSFQRGDEGV